MMLSEDMKESNKGEVIISEYSPDEFLYFLLFLYCDCLMLDVERALELLKVNIIFYL